MSSINPVSNAAASSLPGSADAGTIGRFAQSVLVGQSLEGELQNALDQFSVDGAKVTAADLLGVSILTSELSITAQIASAGAKAGKDTIDFVTGKLG